MELTPEMVKDFETVPELGYIEDLFSDIVGQTAAYANEDAVLLVEDLLANLPEDDQEVLKARFGIGYDGACHSYEEVAAMLNKPVDEIRTHEVRGLATLRSLSRG
jgi:DNA-directed RNA polymerase specialized sigma24 family protein